MVVMAYSAFPTPLYGLYAARDGFGALTITAVFAAYAVGVAISLFLVGHLSDSYGRRRVLLPALALTAASAVLFLVWRDLPGLLVARVINGLAVGAVTATATAWIAELHAAGRPQDAARRAELRGAPRGPAPPRRDRRRRGQHRRHRHRRADRRRARPVGHEPADGPVP